MHKPKDWNKILRYISGEISIDEEMEIVKWMNKDPENEEFIYFLQMIWQMEPKKKLPVDAGTAWERFNNRFEIAGDGKNIKTEKSFSSDKINNKKAPSKRRAFSLLSIAGVAASFIIASLMVWQFTDLTTAGGDENITEEIEYRELKTEKGQRSRIILSDGSIIQLNVDSILRIPESFKGNEDRRVYLEGEAYFEINRDENIRFEVIAEETVTTVLGTRFTVRSYQEDPDVTVVVADGTVSLGYLNSQNTEPAILKDNQKGVIGNGFAPIISDVSNLSIYHGWTTGELVFEQEPLPQMINQLERWFGIDIEQGDLNEITRQKRLSASFTERQPVEDVLQSISLALNLSIEESESLYTYKFFNNH